MLLNDAERIAIYLEQLNENTLLTMQQVIDQIAPQTSSYLQLHLRVLQLIEQRNKISLQFLNQSSLPYLIPIKIKKRSKC